MANITKKTDDQLLQKHTHNTNSDGSGKIYFHLMKENFKSKPNQVSKAF